MATTSNSLQELAGLELLYYYRRTQSKAPSFYLTRRRQLLFAKYSNSVNLLQSRAGLEDDTADKPTNQHLVSAEYLLIRQKLLARKFGPPQVHHAGSPKSMLSLQQPRGEESSTNESPSPKESTQQQHVTLGNHYVFFGMACVFDHHKQPVVAVKFANGDRNLWAACSLDGTISIGTVQPACVLNTLNGHTKGCTDFEWSAVNDFILSTSLDKSTRIWEAKSGQCVRTIQDKVEVMCCSFCTANNNFFVVGNSKGELRVINMSTGKLISNKAMQVYGAARSLCFETTGSMFFVGDELGVVHVYSFSSTTGKASKLCKLPVSPDRAITNLQFSEFTGQNVQIKEQLLLVNAKDNQLRVLTVQARTGILKPRNILTVEHQYYDLRSTFCAAPLKNGFIYAVSGSEDFSISVLDMLSRSVVNQLLGHSSPVLCVAFNDDETLLASSDAMGLLIFWKRQTKQ